MKRWIMIIPTRYFTAKIARAWFCVLLLLCACFEKNVYAQNAPAALMNKDEVDLAVARAIDFLIKQQKPDGSITQSHHPTALTALSLLAMAAVGNQPTDPGEVGLAMRKGLAFLVKPERQDADGFFGIENSRMYGHGITTLLLAEMMGMGENEAQDKQIRERCQKAVDLILRSQQVNKQGGASGGWRYMPQASDADLSVTVWQVMALRGAKNAGLDVPSSAIDQAVGYIRRCYFSPRLPSGEPTQTISGCAYQPGGSPTYAMTAAGLLSLHVCGRHELPEIKGCSDWLMQNRAQPSQSWFMYGTYYFAQGMYQTGGSNSDEALNWVKQQLLPLQNADGSWTGTNGPEQAPGAGTIYNTAMAVLSLAVKYHYLPIYQR